MPGQPARPTRVDDSRNDVGALATFFDHLPAIEPRSREPCACRYEPRGWQTQTLITDDDHDQAASDHLRLQVLGCTQFVGRVVVEAALERGHQVSLFNRGQTNPELFDDAVEKLRGDRSKDLDVLAGRSWDAVIYVADYHPEVVSRSLDKLEREDQKYAA